MSTLSNGKGFQLDGALARLAAEAGPRPALEARVLADAAMVSAERRPAPPKAGRSGGARAGSGRWISRLFDRPSFGIAGAAATAGLALALGYGLFDDGEAPGERGVDEAVLSELSPLESLEREVVAALDEYFLDAPL